MRFIGWAIALWALAGCADAPMHSDTIVTSQRYTELSITQPVTAVTPEPVQSIGLRYRGELLEIRSKAGDGWSPWSHPIITWSEAGVHNASWYPSRPSQRFQVRGTASWLLLETYPHGDKDEPSSPEPMFTQRRPLAPEDLVVSRSEWGARETSGCGSPHTPQFITIHHTATPNNDPTSAAERVRGIQRFHIDQRGWCDIGYHFLIGQDGQIYQGRADEQRSGAHVGGHNANNVGIGFLGNFEEIEPPQNMLDAGIRMVAWLSNTYDVVLDREHVRGHREWDGASTACPGANMVPRLNDIVEAAKADPDAPISLNLSFVAQEDLFNTGTSAGVADAFEGDTVETELLVTNTTGNPLEDVTVQIIATPPYVTTETSTVSLGEIAPGESVTQRFSVTAATYSLGAGATTGVTAAADQVSATAPLDVFTRDRWEWEGGQLEDIEGWVACGDVDQVAVNTRDHCLAARAVASSPCIESPGTTLIDAGARNQISLRVRHYGGVARVSRLFWQAGETQWTTEQSVAFETLGDGQWQEVVLDMAPLPGWQGEIHGLRLELFQGSPDEETPWYDIDYLRSLTGTQTDNDRDGSPAGVDCDDNDPARQPGIREACDNIDNNCDGIIDEGCHDEEDADDQGEPSGPGEAYTIEPGTQVKGCALSRPSSKPLWPWALYRAR